MINQVIRLQNILPQNIPPQNMPPQNIILLTNISKNIKIIINNLMKINIIDLNNKSYKFILFYFFKIIIKFL